MSVEKQWRLFFELTNEATVVAESIGDYTLAELGSEAAKGAADRLGISYDRVIALRQDLRKRTGGMPPGTRVSRPFLTLVTGGESAPLAAQGDPEAEL